MHVLVAFKVTPDYEVLRDADWVAGPGDGVETRFARRILNCFDESALELALRLRDASAASGAPGVSLSALTIGGRDADPHLGTLLALGYAEATRIDPQAALDFSPATTAALIAAHVRERAGSDLLLLGCRSGPGDGGTIPWRVAEELGWPCLTQVTAIGRGRDDRLRATTVAEDGVLQLTLRLPCVLAIGNAAVSHLRVPTLSARLAQRDRRPRVLTAGALAVDAGAAARDAATTLMGLERIDRSRPGVVVGGATPRDRAMAVYRAYLSGVVERR